MKPDFNKTNGLIPAIIQNAITQQVLMLGYMNEEAFTKTQFEKRVTFYSRSRNELWTKGKTSGNYLNVVSMSLDCDNDTILIQAKPVGPTCHTGATTCFGEPDCKGYLYQLEETISERIQSGSDASYTNTLFKRGINKVAQKVGEEAVELVIEAKDTNEELFKNEAADLLYHFLILLKIKSLNLNDIEKVLKTRSR